MSQASSCPAPVSATSGDLGLEECKICLSAHDFSGQGECMKSLLASSRVKATKGSSGSKISDPTRGNPQARKPPTAQSSSSLSKGKAPKKGGSKAKSSAFRTQQASFVTQAPSVTESLSQEVAFSSVDSYTLLNLLFLLPRPRLDNALTQRLNLP